MVSCDIKPEPRDIQFREKKLERVRTEKYYALFFPIPAIAIVIISLVFDFLLWNTLGLKKYPNHPEENALIEECF